MTISDKVRRSIDAHCRPYSCSECGYEKIIFCRDHLIKDAHALIQQLEAQVPRWISVEERLPETQVDVLLFVKHESGGTDFVAVGSRAHWTPNRYYIGAVTTAIDADRVTHWMPLPEPPKEVAE